MSDQPNTPTPWQVMEGRTLLHVETHADNQAGAGIAVCSIPKSRAGDAEFIVLSGNMHAELFALVRGIAEYDGYEDDTDEVKYLHDLQHRAQKLLAP